MAWPEDIHPGAAVRWAMDRLENIPAWVDEHADRLYESSAVPVKPGTPFGVITPTPVDMLNFSGSQSFIGQKRVRLSVVSVRTYPQGGASSFDFARSYNAIFNALCLREFQDEVFDEDGNKIAEVWDSAYQNDVQYVRDEGNLSAYHQGIVVIVTYR